MPSVLVATQEGLHRFDGAGRPGPAGLSGRHVTSIGPSGDEVWAVVGGRALWHAADGATWLPVAELAEHRATCVVVIRGQVFVGTSEARLFRLVDGELAPVPSFDDAEGRDGWYTPWGGPPDTRSLANWDEVVYVNVHVGGILRGDTSLEGWTPTIDIDADVHHVTTAEGMVVAACAGGLAVSEDLGGTWVIRSDGLDAPYARAVAAIGDRVLVSASRGPRGGDAGVYLADLAGGAFERCRDGLPASIDGNIDTYRLDADPDIGFAAFGTEDGRVFASDDAGESWGEIASGLPGIDRVLVRP
jgi:hypothetical protein